MLNNKKRSTPNSHPKSEPIVIKISRKILFLILGVCILTLIISFLSLSITLFTPIKVNGSISKVEKQLAELITLWQAGGLNTNNQTNEISSTDSNIDKVPSIAEPYIKEELETISSLIKETIESESIIADAMLELDASGLNVKGDTSNIQINSVSNSEKVMQDIKNQSRYINKIFFGTKSDNFIVVPSAKASESYEPTQEQWYKLAANSVGEVKWSQIKQDEFTKEYIITGSMAVKSKERVVGVLGVQVSLSKMK